eukprot:12802689-Prorocentrum_lima.AAC.1
MSARRRRSLLRAGVSSVMVMPLAAYCRSGNQNDPSGKWVTMVPKETVTLDMCSQSIPRMISAACKGMTVARMGTLVPCTIGAKST